MANSRSLRRGKFGAHSINSAIGANTCELTVGTETADVINVAGQLKDGNGNNVKEVQLVDVYLSDAATGIGLAATAPDGGVAIGTDGAVMVADVANKYLKVQTEADGSFDLDIEEAGALTIYVCVVHKNDITVSAAVTFAA